MSARYRAQRAFLEEHDPDFHVWAHGEYQQQNGKWVVTIEPTWDNSFEMLEERAKKFGWVAPIHTWGDPSKLTPEQIAEMVADRLRGGPRLRLMEFALNKLGATYEELIEHATDYLDHDDYWSEGGRFEGTCIYDGFWADYELVTGRAVPVNKRDDNFFSCSC
jgi:hypothetical protein